MLHAYVVPSVTSLNAPTVSESKHAEDKYFLGSGDKVRSIEASNGQLVAILLIETLATQYEVVESFEEKHSHCTWYHTVPTY